MTRMQSYFLPGTGSWWLGALAILFGALGVWAPEVAEITKAGQIIGYLIGITEPTAPLLLLGGGAVITGRAKLERTLPEGWVLVDAGE